MPSIHDRRRGDTVSDRTISAWVRAGLIDATTAGRIRAYEAGRLAEARSSSQRPGVSELLIYLATAIAAAGFAVLASANREHVSTPARIAIPGVSSALMFAAGYLLLRTRNDATVRGASLAWLVASAIAVGTIAIAAGEAGWAADNVALSAGLFAAVISVVVWSVMRMHPQIVGIAAAAFLLSAAVSVRASEHWTVAALGASLSLFGLTALLVVEIGILVPRSSARLVAGAALAVGALFAGLRPSPPAVELLALAVVLVLVTAGFRFESLLYIGFGVVAAFGALIELILRHVHNPTVAGLTLVVLGLLLLLATAILRKAQPWSHWGAWRTDHTDPAVTGHDSRMRA